MKLEVYEEKKSDVLEMRLYKYDRNERNDGARDDDIEIQVRANRGEWRKIAYFEKGMLILRSIDSSELKELGFSITGEAKIQVC